MVAFLSSIWGSWSAGWLSKKAEEREEPNEKGKLMELVFFYRRDSAASGQPTTACELYSGTVQPYIQWYSGDSTVSHQKKKNKQDFCKLETQYPHQICIYIQVLW